MSLISLTSRDMNVLRKIQDPESAPSQLLPIDSSLSQDPNLLNDSDYAEASRLERQIIRRFESLERQLATAEAEGKQVDSNIQADYRACISLLDILILQFPTYASAYNNRAQGLRRYYGDSVLLRTSKPLPSVVQWRQDREKEIDSAALAIGDSLDTAISLLSPRLQMQFVSTRAARTLAQAHMQRGALYLATAKQMNADGRTELRVGSLTKDELECRASRDFALGGKYGNQLGRVMAVASNPTAKLCGNIVAEALAREMSLSIRESE